MLTACPTNVYKYMICYRKLLIIAQIIYKDCRKVRIVWWKHSTLLYNKRVFLVTISVGTYTYPTC